MVKTRKLQFAKQFDGLPKETDFRLVEEELPEIKDEEFICEALYFSVDPYMRAYSGTYRVGMTMIGAQVAKIIQSKNLEYPVGNYVYGNFGWQTHSIYNPEEAEGGLKLSPPYLIPEIPGHPLSLYLGILGMTGNTAYFGFTECCNPIAGETVIVSGAGGAVGSHVGQIAKIKGCKVYGITGSDEKGEWLKSLGFDGFINYKTVDNFHTALREMAPRGIDCYFDNVGGELSSTIMQQMNEYGRVAVCGSISAYNTDANTVPKATIVQPSIVMKLLTIKGLHASKYVDRWMEGIRKNKDWLENGKLKYQETITEGFENLPKAFIEMLAGSNIGKAIVKA